jgi:MFS family permease
VPALNLRILTRLNHDKEPGVAAAFLRWTCARAVFHRGYVLTSGIYFVVNARLSASQIVGLGTVMAVTLTLSDIPAGAWSDTFSRKWPLVAGHGFLAAGMVMTGLVTAYPLILCTQVLWALGWACSGGADVAWVTDELGQPGQIARILAARARWDLTGGGAGVIAFGLVGWAVGLPAAIVASGAAMALPSGAAASCPPGQRCCSASRSSCISCSPSSSRSTRSMAAPECRLRGCTPPRRRLSCGCVWREAALLLFGRDR